ncbi:aspartate-semialdehyde dehydrogenase [candidate division WOR-3 bacterium]|uniref:Aspartate-semialdehyde dehydrogenase n=1 Tax=candidate division WOR-3 bacterium TaxID=2052148 RepID=A0A9D5K9A9_UNCW3|nr:aspartate-semialdehyde dehydrogenase [candidate division WOR-3 bacterium]MBD3364833.1 aspartate-semialdehyde dehydrogenase [candidate division WOR-3 bacterium]
MRVGIIGATGLVGRTTLSLLEERGFPVSELTLFASERSAGERIRFRDTEVEVTTVTENWDLLADVFFCSVSDEVTRPILEGYKGDAWIIDKSKVFRMDPSVPLVVPEVNGNILKSTSSKIIANPNCTTIPFVMVVDAVCKVARPERIVATALQSASGAGKDALAELRLQREYLAVGQEVPDDAKEVFGRVLASNLIPRIGSFDKTGESTEERKLRAESRKILDDAELAIYAACTRVPVEVGHSLSATFIFSEEVNLRKIEKSLTSYPGITYRSGDDYVTPAQTEGADDVYCSRLRHAPEDRTVLHLWITTDNLRKGAALNAVQIAESLG